MYLVFTERDFRFLTSWTLGRLDITRLESPLLTRANFQKLTSSNETRVAEYISSFLLKVTIVIVWVHCNNACFSPGNTLDSIQYKTNEMTDFERMFLAKLVAFLMLLNIPVTFDYFLHITKICTTKVLQWKNYRYKQYVVNLCLRHYHKHILL